MYLYGTEGALAKQAIQSYTWSALTCALWHRAGMPLHDAVIQIRKKRAELSCVEVKYANQVLWGLLFTASMHTSLGGTHQCGIPSFGVSLA